MESIVQKQGAQRGSELGEHLHLREEGGYTGIMSPGEEGACEVREDGRTTHSKMLLGWARGAVKAHVLFPDFHKPLD